MMIRRLFENSFSLGKSAPWEYRKLMFKYDLLMIPYIGNQAPIIWQGLKYNVVGFVVYFIYYLLGLHFLLIAMLPFLLIAIGYYSFAGYDYLKTVVMKIPEKTPRSYEKCTDVQIMTKKRRSIRVYQRKYLSKEHEEMLKEILRDVNNSIEDKRVRIVSVKEKFQRLINITDCWQVLVAIIPKSFNDDLSDEHVILVGRKLQEIVLRLTKIGVATCYIGGFRGFEVQKGVKEFNPKFDHISMLVSVGYKSNNLPYVIKGSMAFSLTRKSNRRLFFEEKYGNPLELGKIPSKLRTVYKCAKWAPSSSNEQGTRIVKIGNKFHFYKTGRSKYYSILNLGIAMHNWELACKELNIEGKFVKKNPNIDIPKFARYYWTWIQNE